MHTQSLSSARAVYYIHPELPGLCVGTDALLSWGQEEEEQTLLQEA